VQSRHLWSCTSARRAKRENGGLGKNPPGSTVTYYSFARTCLSFAFVQLPEIIFEAHTKAYARREKWRAKGIRRHSFDSHCPRKFLTFVWTFLSWGEPRPPRTHLARTFARVFFPGGKPPRPPGNLSKNPVFLVRSARRAAISLVYLGKRANYGGTLPGKEGVSLISHRASWGILPQTPVFSLRSARCYWYSWIIGLNR
jgi:hypothetical protein